MGAKNRRRLSRAGGLKKIDYDKQENKIIPCPFDEDSAKVLHYPESGKDLQQDPQVLVHEKSGLRCPCLIPEDVPIDLGVISTSRSRTFSRAVGRTRRGCSHPPEVVAATGR